MQILLLDDALRDLSWFRHYYTAVFPEGEANAQQQFARMCQALGENPFLGHPTEELHDVRELHIPRTPFNLYYRVAETRIEVLRLWDERQGGGAI